MKRTYWIIETLGRSEWLPYMEFYTREEMRREVREIRRSAPSLIYRTRRGPR